MKLLRGAGICYAGLCVALVTVGLLLGPAEALADRMRRAPR